MSGKESETCAIDRAVTHRQLQNMPTKTDESPVIPGLERETPEQQVRKNLERAMFKYSGNLQLYLEKLMERVPERTNEPTIAGVLAHSIVRRRTHK